MSTRPPLSRSPALSTVAFGLTLVLLLAVAPGCVSRKLFIRSDPPGARLIIDGEVVGTTPHEAEFLSYGTRRVELELAGHQRMISTFELTMPWWQTPPFDLFTDVLWPGEIESHFVFDYSLQPTSGAETDWEDARAAYQHMRDVVSQLQSGRPRRE